MPIGAAARLRELLIGAVADAPGLTDGLQAFASFRALSVLWHAGWLGGERGSVRRVGAEVRRRFREIAAARRPVAALAQATTGEVVCVVGEARRSTKVMAPDFLLDDGTGAPVTVLAAGARIVGATTAAFLDEGAGVTVLGFFDREIDPTESAPVSRQPPLRSVLRGSDALPLVVVVKSR